MIFGNLRESIAGKLGAILIEKKEPEAKISHSVFGRERPQGVTFKRLIEYHDRTPQIMIAVSSYKELITGTELVINSENEQAKQILDEWIGNTNFYEKFEGVVTTVLIAGNALLEKLDPADTMDVQEVDMETIISKQRTPEGELQYYEHIAQSGQIVKLGEGQLDRFIEFNLGQFSNQAWARSLYYSASIPRTIGDRVTPPLIELLWSIEDAMSAMLINNAYPITTITYPGHNDKMLRKEAQWWARYKPGDKRLQKIKPEIDIIEAQPGSKYTDYVAHLEKAIELATQFPHDIMTGDFTSRASSETTETIVMKKVRGFQQYLCTKLKTELFEPILEQNGIKATDADITVAFTTQNVLELNPDQVGKLYNDGVMTINETRDWFRQNTGMELDEDDVIQQRMDDAAAQQEEEMATKVDDMESVIKKVVSTDALNESKITEFATRMDKQITSMKKRIAKKDSLTKERMKKLEEMVSKIEELKEEEDG